MAGTKAFSIRERVLSGESVAFAEETPNEARWVPAELLRAAIEQGVGIDLTGAIIEGPFDLRGLRVACDVKIVASVFQGQVDCSYAEFGRTLTFRDCRFEAGANFDAVHFRSDVSLSRTVFRGRGEDGLPGVIFFDVIFGGVLDATHIRFDEGTDVGFPRARFRGFATFHGARFGGPADFSHVTCDAALSFASARFRAPLSGEYLRVGHYVNFMEARFGRTAAVSLREAEIGGSLYCDATLFGSALDLSGSEIGSSLRAERSCFLGAVILSSSAVRGHATLRKARFGRRATVNARSAILSRGLDISGVLAKAGMDFTGAEIATDFEARDARFCERVDFRRATIGGSLQLSGSRLQDLDLENAQVGGVLDLNRARVEGAIRGRDGHFGTFTFSDAVARGIVDLYGVHLDRALVMARSSLRARPDSLSLDGMVVGTQAYLDQTTFRGAVSAVGLFVPQQLSMNRVVFGGETDFYELNVGRGCFVWQSRFRKPFLMRNARVNGETYLNAARFRRSATFGGSTMQSVYLGPDPEHGGAPAEFHDGVWFDRCRLDFLGFQAVRCGSRTQPVAASFQHMSVKGIATFSDAQFLGRVSLYASCFDSETSFQRVRFLGMDGPVDLRGTLFRRNVFFSPAVFRAGADFTFACFEGQTVIRAAFEQRTYFDNCHFRGVADFSDPRDPALGRGVAAFHLEGDRWVTPPATTFADVSFVHAEFDADARFDWVQFGADLDLREARFAHLFLMSPRHREPERLPTSIDLRGCTYQRIAVAVRPFLNHAPARGRPRWRNVFLGDERMRPYDRQSYGRLEQALRRAGEDDEADRAHLAWRRAERRELLSRGRVGRWTLNQLYRLVAHYGIRPYRLAVLSVLLVAAGTTYFQLPGAMRPADAAAEAPARQIRAGDAFGMSLRHFLPVSVPLAVGLEPDHEALAWPLGPQPFQVTYEIRPTTLATILRIAGWILVPLGVASLGGILRRTPGQ